MEASAARTRGSAFSPELVELGFWCVLGCARGSQVRPGADEGGAADPTGLGALLEPALSGHGLDAEAQEQVVALIAATRVWARGAGSAGRISAAEFERARHDLLRHWDTAAPGGTLVWPPTSRTVSVRLGGGRWNEALTSLGVATSGRGRQRGRSRLTDEAQVAALSRFLERVETSGASTSFAAYTQWARDERAADRAVPAPATVRQHFGSWSAALAAARAGGGAAEERE